MLLAMHPLVLLAIGAGAGAFALGSWYFSQRQRALRAIRSVPRVLVSEAVDGSIVRIVGQLRAHAPLLAAPLSGRACASYDVVVEERVKSGKSSDWKGLVHESDSRDFVVEDSSGRALVESARLEATIVLDHHQSSGFLSDASPVLESFLAQYGHEVVGFLVMNKTIRYREGVLEPGETVAVIGRVRWEDDPELGAIAPQRGGYRDTARRRRLVIEPSELGPVRASDEPSALE